MSEHINMAKKAILEIEFMEMDLVTRANVYKNKVLQLQGIFDEQIKRIEKVIVHQESLHSEEEIKAMTPYRGDGR